jgi:DNA-binding MarR family transcriptional regulator
VGISRLHIFYHQSNQTIILKSPTKYIKAGLTTLRELHVLSELNEHGRMTTSKLSNEWISQPSLTSIITKLAKLGLVKRVECRADRRKVYIDITVQGEVVING